MLLYEILEDEFTLDQALKALGLKREQFNSMTPEQFASFRKNILLKSHPDLEQNRGKNIDIQTINRALDVLKNKLQNQNIFRKNMRPIFTAPEWQPDKNSKSNKIYVESYRDPKYIQKHIWEISGKSNKIYTIDAFSDSYFQGRLKVYGSPSVFEEMAQAMRVFNANGGDLNKSTRAVFVSTDEHPKTLFLIYADGRSYSQKPIPLEYNGASQYQDTNFQQKLPIILNKIKELYSRTS